MERKKIKQHGYFKLIIASLIIGFSCSILAFTLKHLTEFFEHKIFNAVTNINPAIFVLLPTIGITSIYFLRKYLFKNRKNKGITEIYKTIDQRKDHLPIFKIPSHFFNGFLTVIFGGSTGIEVSTVVATAAVGNITYEKEFSARMFKKELVCAGVTAGVAILFTNPLAGWLFAMEVIARKMSKTLIISCSVSAFVAWLFILFFNESALLPYNIAKWNFDAIPFFLLLSLFGGLLSVYFTLLVTRSKYLFSKISNNFLKVNIGALLVGLMIFYFPSLYGDSYHGLKEILQGGLNNYTISILLLLALMFLKPLAAALTLGAGGDGGVFAPSIVAGAFLGLLFAKFFNSYFDTHLVLVNFALVGAAATLSASLYAPFTSLILICGLIPNGYSLFVPVLMSCFLAQIFSKRILPYNVYTYDFYLTSKT
ncbi:MAG: chloride channel protein [Daejeonella sp.]